MNNFEPRQFGKYYLIEKIAVGGMAEIYKAKTFGVDGFEKLLAIKRILPHCAADKDFITMLIDEAKLSVILSHANIVQVYDLGKIGDDYFISMEYIHGINLRDIMYRCREAQKPFPVDIAIFIISEVCKGLDYAHRKTDANGEPLNIVHRDISPQNVLISYEGEVKIVDFGIAKAAMNISHTMAGILKGKIAYMSPEQALGKVIDHRTDIFSAGILLYEMLTNSKLFTGESQFEVLKKIRTSRVEVAKLPASIPDLLKVVVTKALAYRPDERYQSAADLQVELTKYLYSTYSDFSPRKLSAFIKDVFAPELKEEQMRRARAMALESQTVSMSVDEGAKQEDIVHRELTATPISISRETPVTGKVSLESIITPIRAVAGREITEERERVVAGRPAPRWSRNVIYVAVALAVAYGLYRYVPAVRFWEPRVAPEAIEAVGTMEVTSVPDGAKILLDGKDTGLVTPVTIGSLQLRTPYLLRLEKDTFKPAEKPVQLTSDTPVSIQINMERMGGILNVVSDPPGAAVLLDGNTTGKNTPATIEDIPLDVDHRITLSKKDFEDFEQVIHLKSTTPENILAPLKAIARLGSLLVTSSPDGAAISLNDQDMGRITPATITDLPLNQVYTVKLVKEGFEPWTRTLTLASAEPVSMEGQLKALEMPPAPPTPTAPPPAVAPAAPAAAPEAARAEEFGSLEITSNPAGARISIDGKATGTMTPATIGELKVGKSYTVSLAKADFEKWSRKIKIAGAKPVAVTGELKPVVKPTEEKRPPPPAVQKPSKVAPSPPPVVTIGEPGQIRVASKPSGAQVFINAELKGTTPLTVSVSPGSVSVTVTKEGMMRYSRRVTIRPGEKVSLTDINLQDLYGEVVVSSDPPRATVVFDGRAISKTPVTIRKVRRDESHTISVSLSGYRTWSQTFSMEQGDKNFNISLERE